MKMQSLLLFTIALAPLTVDAQACQSSPTPPNAPAGTPFFDFQTDKPAQYVRTDSTLPSPDAALHAVRPFPADFALAQFVVDTAGVPIERTLKLLAAPDGLTREKVAGALQRWRFEPALVQGCRVSQLVQTPLRWK